MDVNKDVAGNRRERRKEETRQRLIEAALSLMQEKPFEQISVEEITERADVAKGTFFNYFPTKEHLLMASMQERVEEVYEFLDQLHPESAESQWEVLRQVMRFIAERDGRSLALTRSLFAACCHNDNLRQMVARMIEDATQHALMGFQKGQQSGEFRNDVSAHALAHYAVRLYRICFMEWIMGNDSTPLPQLVDSTLEFFKPAFLNQEVRK